MCGILGADVSANAAYADVITYDAHVRGRRILLDNVLWVGHCMEAALVGLLLASPATLVLRTTFFAAQLRPLYFGCQRCSNLDRLRRWFADVLLGNRLDDHVVERG